MKKAMQVLKQAGPAFITTTTTFGPASLLLAGLAGAQFRYQCTWVLLLLAVERYLFLDLGTRVGVSMPDTLYTTVGKLWGRKLAIVGGILSFLAVAPYAAGNVLGTAMATQLLVGGNLLLWGIFFIILDVCLFLFKGVYGKLEKIALAMVMVMLVTFTATLFVTGWSFGEFVQGLVPRSLDPGPLLVGLALFLTSGSEQGIRHTYMVREKKYTASDAVGSARVDHILSTLFMVVMLGIIMSVGAEVLNPRGVVPTSAPQFATMLQPLAGAAAKNLFGIGLFGAAFTSLTGQPIAVALNLADGFGRAEQGADSPLVKRIAIALVVVAGLWGVIPVVLGIPMINIYWICSLATFFAMPLNGILMLMLASRKAMMKDLSYSKWQLVLRAVVFALVVIFASFNFLRNL